MINRKYFMLAICLLLLTSCNKQASFNINDSVRIELPFQWKTVVIDDQTDINNIITLINSMELKVANNTKVDNSIGSFVTTSGKEPFAINNEEVLKIGKLEYYGRDQCLAIRNIMSKNVYDDNLIIDALQLSNNIIVYANDMDISKELTEKDKQEIIKNVKFTWDQTPGSQTSEYPDYELKLTFSDGNIKQLFIIDDHNVVYSDDAFGWEKFTTNEDLWLYITNIIEPNQLNKENEISYLFNSSGLFIEKGVYKGDYINKKNDIVRCISEAKKVDKISENDQVIIELIFNIMNITYVVALYENGFIYENEYYEKPEICNEIIALITAG